MRERAGYLIAIAAITSMSLAGCDRLMPAAHDKRAAAQAADEPINPDAKALAGFLERVNQYVALHQKLEDSLPHLSKESSPQQIDTHQRALGQLIQEARKTAKPGDIFTPESQTAIKRLLARVLGGADGEALKASIMDENPGLPHLEVNGRYPDTVPLSTIPPQVLQGLPKLPEEMEFRFIGNALILMDVHAHIIVDFIPNAFPR
jgi:hypothetical protein